ncbi:MAG: hypothetical protein J7K95_01855 [Thermoplasmata archaeon]|nr:hypothetical protein [Thermoplasmata archaeon]
MLKRKDKEIDDASRNTIAHTGSALFGAATVSYPLHSFCLPYWQYG